MKDVPRLTHYSVLELFLLFPAPCWVFNLCWTVWKTSHRESLRGSGAGALCTSSQAGVRKVLSRELRLPGIF